MRYQIFLKDKHVTSMEGVSVSFSEEQLRGIASRYDPALHEAPIIIGHPAHDAPAFGWVKGLSFGDDALSAEEHLVNTDFEAMRKTGAFRKVSARFYTPKSANNPTPGEYYLRDIGFLGAMPPAVKGLKLASFADDSELVTAEISFGDLPGHFGLSISRMFGRWRDHLIETLGLEKADQIAPSWEINSMSETAQRADMQPRDEAAPTINSFADPGSQANSKPLSTPENPSMKTPEQLAAELAAANERNAALEAKQAKMEADARNAESASFADGLIAAAKWPTGNKDVLVATLSHLAAPAKEGEALSFGEGDAAQPLGQALRAALESLAPMVSFSEHATKAKAGAGSDVPTDKEMADRARAYKAKREAEGGSLSFAEAVDAVNAGKDQA